MDFRNVGFRLCSERMAIGFIVGLFLTGVKNTPCENPLTVYYNHSIAFILKLCLFALPHSRTQKSEILVALMILKYRLRRSAYFKSLLHRFCDSLNNSSS